MMEDDSCKAIHTYQEFTLPRDTSGEGKETGDFCAMTGSARQLISESMILRCRVFGAGAARALERKLLKGEPWTLVL